MAEAVIRQRSRYCGLRDIYAAVVTENTATAYTTDTPFKLARAINAKITDKFTSEKLYSDDSVEDIAENYEGTDVELEVNALAPQDYKDLFNNLYKNGFLVKSDSDFSKEVAIGYRAKKRNGKYEFVWLYCGRFERPEKDLATKADKIDTKTASLKGSFYARNKIDTVDGLEKQRYEISVDESNLLEADTTAKEAIKDWFSKVQEYTEAVA